MSSAAEKEESSGFDQSRLASFMRRQVILPIGIFLISFGIYLACVLGAVLARGPSTKVLLGVAGGVFIANLAIIAHDAIHRSFTPSRWLNRLIGTVGFLPALHAFGRWEHHHNRVHHRFTAQIGIDNAYSPMTVEQFRTASTRRRLYYRFMRSLAGQPFFYMIEIWLPKMFLPSRDAAAYRGNDWLDLAIVYLWLATFVAALIAIAHLWLGQVLTAAVSNATVFGLLIPFVVFNLIASFVTIVQHTGPKVRWILPTGRPSTHEQKLRGTVHIRFPEGVDWFFHRVMQHIVHHVNPMVPLYRLKPAEEFITSEESRIIVETWTPLYHWRVARDCKLYDPAAGRWCQFSARPSGFPSEQRQPP